AARYSIEPLARKPRLSIDNEPFTLPSPLYSRYPACGILCVKPRDLSGCVCNFSLNAGKIPLELNVPSKLIELGSASLRLSSLKGGTTKNTDLSYAPERTSGLSK